MRRHVDRGPQTCAIHPPGVWCDSDCPGFIRPPSPGEPDAQVFIEPEPPPTTPHYYMPEQHYETGLPGNVPMMGAVRFADMELAAAVRSPDDAGSLEVGPETVEEMDAAAAAAQEMVDAEREE